ncbi:MAG: hypothetical protein IJK49_00230 [Prevotella sp.]|nr:hypothetical protein [Prevotella sp.]
MLKKLLLLVAVAFVGSFAYAQNTPETATVIDNLDTYVGTDPFVFNKADRSVYALNNLGKYEKFGVYEKVYTLKAAVENGEVDYIESAAVGTRNNYIKTDYIPTTETRAEGIFEYDSYFFHDWCALFGVGYYKDGWKNLFTYFAQSNYGRGAIQSSDGTVDTHGSVTWDKKSKFVLDAPTATGTQYDSATGKVLSYIEQRGDNIFPKENDCVTPIYILAMNKTVPAYTDDEGVEHDEEPIVDCQAPGAKFFGLKFYEGETLVRDFVPYVRNGVVGAYDKVNGVFWPATEEGDFTPLTAGSVTSYEGKIVRYLEDNHVYKFTGGEWVDQGEIGLEEIENEDYKDLTTWQTNNDHVGIFQDQIFFEDGNNYIDQYIGTGGFEPLMTKIAVEEGADYNFSFDYLNAEGCWGWSNWSARAAVWTGWDLNTSATFAHAAGDAAILGSQIIGHEKSLDYVPINIDFNAAKADPTLVLQFGYYADGSSFAFEFNNLKVAKYVYPVEYPAINPDDYAEVEPVRWDADGVGYAPLKGGDGFNANESWNKMLDNDATSKYCGTTANAWVMIQATEPVVVKQYSIVTGADTYTYTARNPRAWTLEGSNDKQNWTIIDKVQDYDLIEARNSEEKVFIPSYVPEEEGETGAKESTSTEPFKYFRFTVNDARDGVQIGEFWINEQAHEWANTETIEPTCCKQGQSIATCADCGAKKTTWIPETNAHTWDDACLTDYDVTLVNMSESKDNAHHFKAKRSYFERGNAESWADITGDDALAWTEVDFDDSDWDTLTLPMGDFGNYNTYWGGEDNAYQIRMPFVIDDASKVDELVFQSLHDDTYWVYLNGELILQVDNWNNGGNVSDMDSWDLLSSTGAQSFPNGGTEVVNYAEPIPLDLLQDGENVLAVYIQENWGGQYFDCRLSAMGTLTGVKNVETQTTAGKNEVYDLQGRKMNSKNLPKGIYIINGKKVVK